jgi:hypothetical protein
MGGSTRVRRQAAQRHPPRRTVQLPT